MPTREEYQQNREKDLQERNLRDWRRILKAPEGRRVIFELMQVCQYRNNPFVPGDQHATAFHCGQQSIGLWIERMVKKADISALVQMEQEYEAEIKQFQTEVEKLEDY